MVIMRLAALAFCVSVSSITALAGEVPPLLEQALARGETADAVRWAFTQRAFNEDVDLTLRFTPMGDTGSWQIISPEDGLMDDAQANAYQSMTDLIDDPDPDSDLTYEQIRVAIGDQDVEIIEDTSTHVIYRFAPLPWDDVEPDEVSLIEHLLAEVTVEKTGGYVSSIRMYAPDSFRHMVVARISFFEQIMRFAPEPVTGLPLMVYFSQEIRARALFQNINRRREEMYSDFLPMSRSGAALSCGPDVCAQEFVSAQ